MGITASDVEEIRDWLASFGADEAGGVTRLLFTPEWLAAQRALKERFEQAGMVAEFDEVGNLAATFPGSCGTGEIVACGSHVDTVVNGGKLDGALGVFGGFLAIKDLVDTYGTPRKSLRVISMAEEEGSRFPFVYWGSKNLVGTVDESEVAGLAASDGTAFDQAMRECGFSCRTSATSPLTNVTHFLELHIEQGNTLELEGKKVGVVTAICGQRRYTVRLHGQANHAGTTRMRYRHDAVQVFSQIVTESLAKAKAAGDPLVLTFGHVEVSPNTVNVVPGEVEFTVDCRHTDKAELVRFTEELEADMARIAAEHGVGIGLDRWLDEDPVPMSSEVIATIQRAAEGAGASWRLMHSGAGHDSQVIAPHVPTGMIFVPSVGGVSHNPAERTETEDLMAGIDLLEKALYELAY